jgi:hypothetical protein
MFDAIDPVPISPMEEGFLRDAFSVVVVARLEGCIEEDALIEALWRVQRRHPKLRAVKVVGANCSLFRFDRNASPIPFTITDYDNEEAFPWQEAIHRLVRIDPNGPLMAVTVCRSRVDERSVLITSVHHGIADGRSAIALVRDVLTEHANVQAALPPLPPLPVVSASRARFTTGWLGRLRLLRRFVRVQRLESRSQQTILPEAGDAGSRSSEWVHWVLSREETLTFVRRCRKEQVAPTGALVAGLFCGLMDCLQVPTAAFKCVCPFDVRDLLEASDHPPTAGDLGSFVGTMRGFYNVASQPRFWDLARQVHQDIETFVEHGGPALSFNLTHLRLHPWSPQVEAAVMRAPKGRPTVLVTNYGIVDMGETYGSLRLRGLTLGIQGDDISGPQLLIEALVLGQRLNVGFICDGLDRTFWEQIQVAFRRHLDDALRSG